MAKAGRPKTGTNDPTITVRVRINDAKYALARGWEHREIYDLGLKVRKEQENKKRG